MKPTNHIWVVQKKVISGWIPDDFYLNREDARVVTRYYNGFSHGTKNAKFRPKKYVEAK